MSYENAQKGDEQIESRVQRKANYIKKERRSWFFLVVSALAIALCLRFFVFEFVRVDGKSMEQTLHDNEYVFMERVTYWFREPEHGDVIICTYPNEPGKTFVKRVIGTQGDELKIVDGVLYINDVPEHADYTYFNGFDGHSRQYGPFVVPDNCVFVMGDNRNISMDSRDIGPLSRERVLGKAPFVIWPLPDIRGL